jgi:hypothetical protein
MAALTVRSSYSAQPSTAKANPFVERSIAYVAEQNLLNAKFHSATVADQGCGKLRHLPVLEKHYRRILFVDTADQFARRQKIFESDNTTIAEYAKGLKHGRTRVEILTAEEFEKSNLRLDLILNACVLDVEIPSARKRILRTASQNLKVGGLLLLIVPRNDQTILVRCSNRNKAFDGHAFEHHGIVTFYKNFKDASELIRAGHEAGLDLVADLSVYRQACLIFKR